MQRIKRDMNDLIIIYLIIGFIVLLTDYLHTGFVPDFFLFFMAITFWPIYLYYLIEYWNKV